MGARAAPGDPISVDPCLSPCPSTSHEDLQLGLMAAGRQVRTALDDASRFPAIRDNLARFCLEELLPHLEAEDGWLQASRRCPERRLLAEAVRAEARAIEAAVNELVVATSPCQALAATRAVHALLAAHAHHMRLLSAAGKADDRRQEG